MPDTTEICRFDYVRQPGGGFDWCVEAMVTREDPLSDTGFRHDVYGPMTPALAQEKFGLSLADVIDRINLQNQAYLTEVVADLAAARTDLAAEQEAHATTRRTMGETMTRARDLLAFEA